MSRAVQIQEDSDDDERLLPWVSRFLHRPGNEFFCAVDTDFILDRFNLTDLGRQVPNAQAGYDYLSKAEDEEGDEDEYDEDEMTNEERRREDPGVSPLTASAAHQLFGLIHQRFIVTPPGLSQMKKKYVRGDFGKCPRVLCAGQHLLPIGLSDLPRRQHTKTFCPHCKDAYVPRIALHQKLDGAYFGTTFPHLFMLHYKMDMRPASATLHRNPYTQRRAAAEEHEERFEDAREHS